MSIMKIIARTGKIRMNAHKEITISNMRFPKNLYIGKPISGPRLPDFKFVQILQSLYKKILYMNNLPSAGFTFFIFLFRIGKLSFTDFQDLFSDTCLPGTCKNQIN